MDDSRLVELTDAVGSGIILCCRTGIWFSNQSGGTSCLQPRAEGIYLPIGNAIVEGKTELRSPAFGLRDYFVGPPWNGLGAVSGLTPADADFVDGVLGTLRAFDGVRVDRSRLSESHEAWVHVTINAEGAASSLATLASYLGGFDPLPTQGVLVWPNSD